MADALEFHKEVSSDISRIMDYYEDVNGQKLSNEFHSELQAFFLKAAASPEAYYIWTRDLRRVNLERYNFLSAS